jgi:hypothetical protein
VLDERKHLDGRLIPLVAYFPRTLQTVATTGQNHADMFKPSHQTAMGEAVGRF